MKVLNKKKFKTEKEAIAFAEKKYGKSFEVAKEHGTRWLLMPSDSNSESLELKPWKEFVKEFQDKNPSLNYAQACKAASPLYQSLKEAVEAKEATKKAA